MKNPFENARDLVIKDFTPVDNKYMVGKVLSTSPLTFGAATTANKYLNLPTWAIDALYNNLVDKSKLAPRFNWIKNTPKKGTVLKEKISRTFHVNDRHADEIVKLLNKLDLQPETMFGLKEGE